MNIAVMGATGMLGMAFMRSSDHNYNIIPVSRKDFDFTDTIKLINFLDSEKPDVVINTAANINLQDCEDNQVAASEINVDFVKHLSTWCSKKNSFLIHISTDHFYDYGGNYPHKECDEVVLLNEYAKQKYSAENFVKKLDNHLIVRTSILGYRHSGSLTFIEWLLSMIHSKKQIAGFVDAYTSSIDVDSFVKVIFLCIKNGINGLYNISCSEVYSKYDLIEAVKNALYNVDVNLVRSNVSQLSPVRASCCGLDVNKIQNKLKISLPTLNMVVENLFIQENYNEIQ